jgi:uncharacterized membrane protein
MPATIIYFILPYYFASSLKRCSNIHYIDFHSMQDTTNLSGVPVPSGDPVFLSMVVVHIVIAIFSVLTGLVAMLASKGSLTHSRFGRIYFGLMCSSFVTVVILSVMRWPHNIHLLTIGTVAFGCAYFGRKKVLRLEAKRFQGHTWLMGMSYILLLTGFYVDNGKNLPLWALLPQWSFYVIPAAVGVPIILKVLRTHYLMKA